MTMKNWTWKQWTALGIAAASIITEVVLIFTAPGAALTAGIGFVLGAATCYLAMKKKVVNL